MRILALSTWWPFPADNGARMRIASLLEGLAARHEVHLAALSQDEVSVEQHRAARLVCASASEVRELAWRPQRFEQIESLWRPEPASVRATWNQAFADLAQQRARDISPDVVIAFASRAAPYALRIAGAPRILEELEIGNIETHYLTAPLARRPRAWLTWAKTRDYTRRLLQGFDACTVVSERERAIVAPLAPPGQLLAVIPNGTSVAAPPGLPEPELDTLIYPGALSYDANLDAMRYFLGEIFPLVRAARPGVRLRITGKTTPEQRAALPSAEGVELTGYVHDIRAAVAGAWAEVVPLRAGGGTRLKVLEALALGTPVVSTGKGAEGLDLAAGEDLLIADTPEQFAQATLRLLGDRGLRERLAAHGRATVLARYDWRAIAGKLADLVEQVAVARGEREHEPAGA